MRLDAVCSALRFWLAGFFLPEQFCDIECIYVKNDTCMTCKPSLPTQSGGNDIFINRTLERTLCEPCLYFCLTLYKFYIIIIIISTFRVHKRRAALYMLLQLQCPAANAHISDTLYSLLLCALRLPVASMNTPTYTHSVSLHPYVSSQYTIQQLTKIKYVNSGALDFYYTHRCHI